MTENRSGCYCSSQKLFTECCSGFLSGDSLPETPEQLMRSRFSAFCTKQVDYLISTHHPSKRQPGDRVNLEKSVNEIQWLGLTIIKADRIRPGQKEGMVEFAAFYQYHTLQQLHEASRFVYEKNRWFYLDGDILDPIKWGRNTLCWCGSNKKFKKCHGKS